MSTAAVTSRVEDLNQALRALVKAAEAYMGYHREKLAPGLQGSLVGLWPAINAARVALGEPQSREGGLLGYARGPLYPGEGGVYPGAGIGADVWPPAPRVDDTGPQPDAEQLAKMRETFRRNHQGAFTRASRSWRSAAGWRELQPEEFEMLTIGWVIGMAVGFVCGVIAISANL